MLFKSLRVYDWITIGYIIIGIACFIWTSIGNDYVLKKIDKKRRGEEKTAQYIYFDEIRRSWLRNQNIWIAVEYFLVGLSYLSMVIVIYMTVDHIVDGEILKIKTTIYAIINLLSSAFRDYLSPRKKSVGARKAYLLLNKAIMKYDNGDERNMDGLVKALDEGESIITTSTYEDN